MVAYEYGNSNAVITLVQPVDDHDISGIDAEVAEIQRLSGKEFRLLAIKVDSWNHDLSPWPSPAVFGKDDFGDGAGDPEALSGRKQTLLSWRVFAGSPVLSLVNIPNR